MDDAGRVELVIVDDEPDLAELLGDYVQDPDVDLTCFVHPKDALAHMIANDRPRLLLCDYSMPDMSGLELAETIERFQATPLKIVMMSGFLVKGFTDEKDYSRIEEKYPIIHKPWRSDIALTLGRWLHDLKIAAHIADHSST